MIATRRTLFLLLFIGALGLGLVSRAGAQITVPSAAPGPAVSGLDVEGLYETAPIVLDGNTLFRIGALVNPPLTQIPIATRVADVQTALEQLVAQNGSGEDATTVFDPRTLRVHIKREGDVDVITAIDAKHSDPLPILTVTTIDARTNDTDLDALAAQWQSVVQSALVRALDLRQPAAEKRNVQRVTRVAIVLVAASLIVVGGLRVLWRRMEVLEGQLADQTRQAQTEGAPASEEPQSPGRRRRQFAAALRELEPAQRLRLFGAIAETLMWALLLAWFLAITWGLSLFAETTPLAQTITRGALGVAGIVIVTGLLNRIFDIIITRAATAWRLRHRANSDDRARLLLRIPTIARAVAGAKTFILVFVAALSVFGQIGVPIGSVVTIGGLAAIALSLAAQNFVRDFLNGFLVLYEDQYVVGDFVTINSYNGSVETLTLRMVQLRDSAGDLITIPHSSVVNVVNQSRNWSRVDYRVPVDPGADIAKAVAIVRGAVEALAGEGDWTHGIGAPLEWIGIDGLSKDSVIVRASIKTAPLRQFELRRRINERVRDAFAQAGIALGAPLPT
jgi:small-conductance mechanosensitive channel